MFGIHASGQQETSIGRAGALKASFSLGKTLPELELIGLDGRLHAYPQWFFLLLKQTNKQLVRSGAAGILEREPKNPHMRILPSVLHVLRPLLEDCPYYPLRHGVKSFDPGFSSGKPRHCGRRPLIDLLECGVDDQVANRELERSRVELNHQRSSSVRTRQIVEEVRARRRVAA